MHRLAKKNTNKIKFDKIIIFKKVLYPRIQPKTILII